MNKNQLIETLAFEHKLPRRIAKEVVHLFFETMARALERGERIELRGFGSFRVNYYEGYTGRNPRTGEPVEVLPKRLPLFRQSSLLHVRSLPQK